MEILQVKSKPKSAAIYGERDERTGGRGEYATHSNGGFNL